MIFLILLGGYQAYQEAPGVFAQYDDDEVLAGAATSVSFSEVAFNSASEPDERGVIWKQPFDSIIETVVTRIKFNDVDRDCDIVLYDRNSNVLGSITLEPDEMGYDMSDRLFLELPFPRVRLREGKIYRLSVKPTTTDSINMLDVSFPSVDARKATFGFGYLNKRKNCGPWTDDTAAAIELTPVLKTIGSTHRNM